MSPLLLFLTTGLCLMFAWGTAAANPVAVDSGFPQRYAPRPEQLAQLRKALAAYESKYDPAEQMTKGPLKSPGYHTTLKSGTVHDTRGSLWYAVMLLDTMDDALLPRAEAILRKVISLQDQDPQSKTYGIWSWFLEEPLSRMSPPDWNWADFCGAALLQVALDHRQRLKPDLAGKVDEAIKHAARSIKKRNVSLGYTNIAIMGSYVTLVASELYDWPEMREYAQKRWRNFCEYTRTQGALTEYNSPTYTVVALKEVGRIRIHVKDAEMRRLAEEVYHLAWEEIARHFHVPTRQWAGPHSRAYSSLLKPGVLALIQQATAGRIQFGVDEFSAEDVRLPLPCPPDLESYFTTLKEPREFLETFEKSKSPVVGTTHLEPAFALGSVNRGDLWNQRRALLAYWGDAQKPAYLHLRFLHDDYDFAAAQFRSVQQGGTVLAGVFFAVDGGDTHVGLDRIKNATIRARDLRLRFELGGAAGTTALVAPGSLDESIHQSFGPVSLTLSVPYAQFSGFIPRWSVGTKGDLAFADAVFYQGPEREFNLAQIAVAAAGLSVHFSARQESAPKVTVTMKPGRLQMNTARMQLDIPVKPGKRSDL
ncbi:MAG: hypothetical protein WCO56_27385 [Verrucomicrobiota bacterium]